MSKTERLATLPLALPIARAGAVGASCPSCGAALAANATDVSARCAHRATESLLPIPMVEQRLRRLHTRVVELREQYRGATAQAIGDAD